MLEPGNKAVQESRDDLDDTDSSDASDDLLREDSEGWEDAEPDEEKIQVKDFFSDAVFPDAKAMVKHCTETHGLDFSQLIEHFGGYVFVRSQPISNASCVLLSTDSNLLLVRP